MKFALSVLPHDLFINEYYREVKELRAKKQITLPTTLKKERQINLFLRTDDIDLIDEIEKETNKNIEILTDSQITTITKKLKKYNFLDRETVKRRFTYYSKKLRGEKFRKALIDDLAKRKFAKKKAKIDSLNIDMLIDKEVKNKLQAEYESIKMNDKEKIIFQN